MRTRRSFLSLATMIVFMAATMATALLTTPLLLGWLGEKRFGVYRVITDLFGYLTLLEFGLSGALGPLLAKSIGQGDVEGERKTLAAGVRAYMRVAALTVGGGLILAATITVWTTVPAGLESEARWACVVQALGFLGVVLIPFRSALDARQKGYVINLLLTAQAVVVALVALALARLGWGITGQAVAVLAGLILFYVVLLVGHFRSNVGVLQAAAGPESVDAETRNALRRLGGSMLVLQLTGRVSVMTDNLVVGRMLGPELVTVLYVTQRLAVLAQGLLQGVGSATWAALADLHARGEHETYRRRLVELTGFVTMLGLAGLLPIVAYNHHFIHFWGVNARQDNDGGLAIVIAASVNALALALTSLWAWTFTATGRIELLMRPSVAAAVLNLAASILLTWLLGLVGPLLGTSVALVGLNIWYLPWLMGRTFGISPRALAGAVLRPLALGVPYGVALWWFSTAHTPWGLVGLGVEMALAGLGFLVLCGAFVLGPDEREVWWDRLRALWPARRGVTTPVV